MILLSWNFMYLQGRGISKNDAFMKITTQINTMIVLVFHSWVLNVDLGVDGIYMESGRKGQYEKFGCKGVKPDELFG